MPTINENFLKLEKNYLFINIAKKVNAFMAENPDAPLIRMGIGDVTLPIAPVCVEAMKKGADEMGVKETFRGYEDSGSGYDFLKKAIAGYYEKFGVSLELDEIRVNDGAKSDCGNIVDIFGDDNIVLITDPAYPVYVDSNKMNGRTVIYADSDESNGFAAMPNPEVHADLIYLCSPNNPTGTVLSREALQKWVDYANATDAVILFDAAYERFITDPAIPHSIYEIPGAKTCAIEFRSFSKTAGFTGARCGYTVVPRDLVREGQSLNAMWNRRQTTKFNGASYVIQRGAAAIYTPEGAAQVDETIDFYRANARTIKEGLAAAGLEVYGADNSPYVWCRTPNGTGSWDFFNRLLEEANVITTPGAGFGPAGEGYIRLTAFGDAGDTQEAVERIKRMLDAESRD